MFLFFAVSHRGAVAIVLDCDIVDNKFEFQSCDYVLFLD